MTHTEARELANQFGTRMCDENGDTHGEELYCFDLDGLIAIKEALAQRTWVGLTDEDMADITSLPIGTCSMMLKVEAKLKEKNT